MKHRFLVVCVLFVFLTAFSSSSAGPQDQIPGNIYTVAGGGQANNVSALLIAVGTNSATAVDGQGNVYIAASNVSMVYKVDNTGTATVFAGTGIVGHSGDGGPATSAKLINPQGIAVDSSGNVFIADESDSCVRKVDNSGIITTFAGTPGFAGFAGDSGPATKAKLDGLVGLAVDSGGNVYIAEFGNNRVRKVNTSGTITTFAGNGTQGFAGDNGPATSAELNFPFGVAVDSSSNVYIGDGNNHRVRKVDATGKITTFAGGGTMNPGDNGPATDAQLELPQGLAVDGTGNVFIADDERIRKVDTSGTITTVAGNGSSGFSGDGGPATSAELGQACAVGVANAGITAGMLYIADCGNFNVRKVDLTGTITSFAGDHRVSATGDGGPATSAQMGLVAGVAVDGSGNLYAADSTDSLIRKVDTSGNISTIAGNGTFAFNGDGGPAVLAAVDLPEGLALDAAGDLFIADTFRIRKIDTSGNINTVAGNGTPGFSGDQGPATKAQISGAAFGVAVDGSGNLYIADGTNQRIRKVDASGIITTVVGNGTQGFAGDNGPATSAELNGPFSVAVDSHGNLFIGDQQNNRVRKVDTSGTITTVAGNGTRGFTGDNGPATSAEIEGPDAVALDKNGNLFIIVKDRIRKIDLSGTITTVAGNGAGGISGDGGPALNAGLSGSFAGLTLDSAGNLFIGDGTNNRVRKVINASGVTLFSISPSANSLTVSARGGSATSTISVAPANGFSGSVNLSCAVTATSGSAGSTPTCSLNPQQLSVGPATASATLTVSLPIQSSLWGPVSLQGLGGFTALSTLSLAALLMSCLSRRRHPWAPRLAMLVLFACILAGIGCGGGSTSPGPQPSSFQVTTTATSGSATASTTVTVSVQ